MDVRELTKSALSLPWAISVFGMQQVASLVSAPPSVDRMTGASKAFDAASDATVEHLDGWLKQTYELGNSIQRALVDVLTLHAPAIDSGTLMRAASDLQSGPFFQALVKYGMPPVAWVDSFLVASKDAPAVAQEFANKLYIITLVTQAHAQLGLQSDPHAPLPEMVMKTAELETFPRLWAVEGLGNYAGDRALAHAAAPVAGLLTDASTATLPPWSLTMLHAGIGMSFAKHVLKRLRPASDAEVVKSAIEEFRTLCRDSSRPGYTGAALESLGLAARTLYPNVVHTVDRHVAEVDEDLQGYFWHGVGRAIYFDPMNMLPSVNAPWRAVRCMDEEAPHDLARRNVLSGIAWALTVVNMRHPQVMEAFLQHHAALAADNDAFVDGVTSSLTMRYDTTREDDQIAMFMHHVPSSDPAVAAQWRQLITTPCERALRDEYGPLVDERRLDELFHYRRTR